MPAAPPRQSDSQDKYPVLKPHVRKMGRGAPAAGARSGATIERSRRPGAAAARDSAGPGRTTRWAAQPSHGGPRRAAAGRVTDAAPLVAGKMRGHGTGAGMARAQGASARTGRVGAGWRPVDGEVGVRVTRRMHPARRAPPRRSLVSGTGRRRQAARMCDRRPAVQARLHTWGPWERRRPAGSPGPRSAARPPERWAAAGAQPGDDRVTIRLGSRAPPPPHPWHRPRSQTTG